MTPEELREIVAAGETLAVEFKGEAKQPLSDADLVEAVVCLSNRRGDQPGWLLVGVEDDGRVTGARPRHEGSTDPARLQALVANRTRPSVGVDADVVVVDGRQIVAIRVPPSGLPVGTADGRYVRRTIDGRGRPACVPFHFHEMQARQADRGLLDYSSFVVAEAKWDDLDPLEFERFRRAIREGQGRGDASLVDLPDAELAKALGAVEANHEVRAVRVLGLLLFGREGALRERIPTHEIAFQELDGTEVRVNDFFRWPLLRAMDEIMTRFRARYRERELMMGLLRVAVPDYPEPAFREGLANAMIHRDYARLGAIHVQWHRDRIEISNPGGLPDGVTLENILVTPPKPRSALLADAFKRAGLVERTARGIDTIFLQQLRNGRPAPSYERSNATDVVLALPGGEANLDFVRLVVEENRAGRLPGLDELLLLNRLWLERSETTQGAARLIQKPESTARTVLQGLVEAGLVEARGERKGRTYHLSAATYRRLGEQAAYVRQRGFEPLQQEQMVVQYIEAHGAITRAQVADLCRINPRQAGRLLQRMVRTGKLVMHGTRRHARYDRRS
ncbi:MAG: putative DNA binding domain-containing protein [Acidobacteria bacterium]|nr:putative DNA binding domain-containing protein [Acidobacteriota bacterium]